ncbi:BMP family lipoprotein [Clavibacter michiganensis]|uniref:Membrane lipoprotein TmpC n=1 Tax=Clavibacter michiganensis TaxID=28447 RepID=A0A251YSL7_9MICO|nr:BMP family ABC transporter substrate-binding protein [Clavibacter michiganensis]OUE27247.1 Membrane lipoprotein TmpC precursor [Clavibacter michiganensis]
MTITTRKAALGGLAAVGITAILAGCGAAPETTTGGAGGEATSDLVSCMVSDSGGFDDKSFNQLGFEGLTKAATDLGLETPTTVESAAETDFGPNLTNLADQGCGLIVTVGFLLADATKEAAEANPDIEYAIIDDASIDAPNVKPITFNTSEAAFLAGYSAAAYSKTGTVGTFGGLQIPTVTIFMDGFVDGVAYYNEQKGKDVKAIGWDVASQSGSFTGEFVANQTAKTAAQTLIDQGADVIMPVGGPIFLSAGEAIRDSSDKQVVMVGVDSDAYETAPDLKDLFLTSVLKGIDSGVEDVVKTAADDQFDATPYVGTLANGGVDIASFHDYESEVPSDLSGELDAIKAGIVDGSITVESPSSLTK